MRPVLDLFGLGDRPFKGGLRGRVVRVRDSLSGGGVARDHWVPGSNPVQDLKNEFQFHDSFRVSPPWGSRQTCLPCKIDLISIDISPISTVQALNLIEANWI